MDQQTPPYQGSQPIDKIREEFIEQIGLIAQNGNLTRIGGRIVGMLLFDGSAYSFSELAQRLQVSRGSISSNVRALKEVGIIVEVGKPGDRQTYYKLAENPFSGVLKGAAQRARLASDLIERTVESLPSDQSDRVKRIQTYQNYYTAIANGLTKAAQDLDQ